MPKGIQGFQKGQKPTGKPFQKGHTPWMKGKKHTPESIEKLRLKHLGKKIKEETKEKIRLAHLGERNHFFGKHHTEESNRKNREAHLGEKSSRWRGGISSTYLKQFAPRPKPNNCEVCGGGGKIIFEHDHETRKFRGWLCMRCNWVLGQVRDNGELLVMLKNYLDKSRNG